MRFTDIILVAVTTSSLILYTGCPATRMDAEATRSEAAAGDTHPLHDHEQDDTSSLHEGHDHDNEDEVVAGHIGHDHQEIESESHAGHDHGLSAEVDEHGGHDHETEAYTVDRVEAAEVDPHAGHDHGEESTGIVLSLEQLRELDITSAPAGPGSLGRELQLTGEIAINEDSVTHVSPRISGIIRKVNYGLGDHVSAGMVLLELESIELAEIRSEYLAMLSRIELAQHTLEREQALFEKGISAEQDYLAARQALEEELISLSMLERKLASYGMTKSQIGNLGDGIDSALTEYEVVAPVSGEIIEKHASLGESVDTGSEVFTIGDMSTVWVRLNVYQQDFIDVTEGMDVFIDPGHGIEPVTGSIDYIEPIIGEETRTAVARVVLSRSNHAYRPGLFVTGYLQLAGDEVDVVVPRNAVVDLDQDKLVFVRSGTEFEPRLISIGRETAISIEVVSGLEAGEEIVVTGAFQLKAELLKGTFDPHAGHAH